MDWFLGILLVVAIAIIIYLAAELDKNKRFQERLIKNIESKAAKQDHELAVKKQEALKQILAEQEEYRKKIRQEEFELRSKIRQEEAAARAKLQSDEEAYKIKLNQSIALFNESLAAQRAAALQSFEAEIAERKKRHEELLIQLESQANAEISQIQSTIEEWRSKQNAVVESFRKLDELANADSFHRIQFTATELNELLELRSVVAKLSNPMPFYKAIYDIYYKNKINELVLRVVGNQRVGGIYKITHIASGRTYVGQSVDIGNRWKQHAKRGCGADIITANKLYPAMLEFGVEAFQFEIVEVIEAGKDLSGPEKYWQEYFKSMEFGYSMK